MCCGGTPASNIYTHIVKQVMETTGRRGKTDKIMRIVQRRVSLTTSTAPAEYQTFIDILGKELANSPLLKILEKSYLKHAAVYK